MTITRLMYLMSISAMGFMVGCSDNDDNDSATPATSTVSAVQAFSSDGVIRATIKRTDYGVPHIQADNLEGIGFGSGYAQAQDNLCILADGFIKANSERSLYFGPHASLDFNSGLPTAEDNGNLISDFGYKALKIRQMAEQKLPEMSDNSRALISGFTHGYNQYLADVKAGKQTAELFCAGQPWVKEISSVDMLTYIFSIAQLPGAANFFDLIFFANPGDGQEYLPRMSTAKLSAQPLLDDINQKLLAQANDIKMPQKNPRDLGSNGWGLGKDKTENGRGMVLVNPHFPHTGNLRFWQSHITIPDQLDMMGGSLVGMPGVINIGFNHDIAWTHTFSTAEHFVVYNLELTSGDRMQYLFEGTPLPITKETMTVQVNAGPAGIITLAKDIYFSDKGPILEAPADVAPFAWDDAQAFTIQDVNAFNMDPLDHWLAMNLANNLDEFKQAYVDYDGMVFNNTMAADKEGNAFYIDDSATPGLSDQAVVILKTSKELKDLRQQAGFTILPNSGLFHFSGATPYAKVPQLIRTDFVQNSNDSFWSTNLNEPLEYYSPLYGPEREQLTLRTRMGLKLLDDSAGDDGKFSLAELETAALSNRSYLAELVLPELLAQCEANPDKSVSFVAGDVTTVIDVGHSCTALQAWNGKQDNDSIGGALLREFAFLFEQDKHLTQGFDYTQAATTPAGLINDGSALTILAHAQFNLGNAGFEVDAPLGTVQFSEKSLPNGMPSGARLPWPGTHHQEGGFNVFSTRLSGDDTLIPQHTYPAAKDAITGAPLASGLTAEGYPIRYGSSWMMAISFTDEGPVARGILTYSQSSDITKASASDQSLLYSTEKRFRDLRFNAADIEANLVSTTELETVRD